MQDASQPDKNRIQIELGQIIINKANRMTLVGCDPIKLTSGEFEILWFLATRAGEVVTRDELYKEILAIEYDGINRSLDLRISRLRKKLGDSDSHPQLIKSIRSDGYLLTTNWVPPL